MAEVTVSSKNQIVIPRDARRALRLKPGDKVLVVVRGDRAVLFRKPKSYRAALASLGPGVYPADYLQKERDDWK